MILLAIWKVEKASEFIPGIAITLAIMQFGLFGFNYVNAASELQRGIALEEELTAAENIFRYSDNDNVIHIIADGFQADVLNEILSTDVDGDRLKIAMNGFTVFNKHVGAFPHTHMSIPAILSGNIYENHIPTDDFMKSSLGGNSIISLAKQNGYEVDLGIPRGALVDIYKNVEPDHIFPVDNGGRLMHDSIIRDDVARLSDLSPFRAFPHNPDSITKCNCRRNAKE